MFKRIWALRRFPYCSKQWKDSYQVETKYFHAKILRHWVENLSIFINCLIICCKKDNSVLKIEFLINWENVCSLKTHNKNDKCFVFLLSITENLKILKKVEGIKWCIHNPDANILHVSNLVSSIPLSLFLK